ncbi:MAG: hypothetical protein NUV51_03865 [Sulfuricaulis sp.]|nr:hypothetical protein [Sulfuricaulis sp.]
MSDQRKKVVDALVGKPSVLNIPYYAADPGRFGPSGNQTGQPMIPGANRHDIGMYPSAARSQLVPNPNWYPGSPLPQMIPADMAEMLQRIQQQGGQP